VRRRKALSVRDLAREAGVAVSTISVLESGRGPTPNPRTVRRLSEALGIDPAAVIEFRRSLGLDAPNVL
jgi:transcriptional regulator with XRE-family HTH domain